MACIVYLLKIISLKIGTPTVRSQVLQHPIIDISPV